MGSYQDVTLCMILILKYMANCFIYDVANKNIFDQYLPGCSNKNNFNGDYE